MSNKDEDQAKRSRIFQTLRNLTTLPKVEVKADYNADTRPLHVIKISHPQEHLPNLVLKWVEDKSYYRVYIHVATTSHQKTNAGYCICTIGNCLAATGLVMLYSFLHKNRANNRTEAE